MGGGARQNTHTNTQHVRALTAPVPLHNPCGPLPRMDGQASGGVVEGRAPCSLSPGARPAWREGVPPPARAGRVQGAYSPPRAPLLPRSLPCAHTWPERERACTCAGGRGPLSLKKKKNSTGNFHFALAAGSAAATWRTPAAAGKTVAEEHRCWGRGEVVVGIVLCEEASRWRRLQRPGRCHVNDNERSAAKWLPILHTALSLFSRAPRASLSLLPVRDQPED